MQTLRHLAGRWSLESLLRHGLFLLSVFGPLAFLLSQQPIGQDTNYHDFADQRTFLGIANFLDVVSNVPFVLVGLAGMNACLASPSTVKGPAWLTFFAGVTLLGAGSAYYHWSPNGETLVWDRLPMALAFMGLFVALVTDYASTRVGTVLLVPAVLAGLASVMYWRHYDDLRLYYWIQLLPLLTIPAVMALYRARYTHQGYLLVAFALYVLAKLSETHDEEVFTFTSGLFSGHTLKHILAALAICAVLMMLKTRTLNRGATQH
jgi:hypothetical protein